MPKGMLKVLALVLALSRPDSAAGQAVGTVVGAFDVSPAGSARYTIPIKVPPGTAGTAPALALTYDSNAGAGPLGAGWSLEGASTITRGPKSIYSDGRIDGVRLSDADALFFDGQRLIPVGKTGAGQAQIIEYRKEADDLTQVRQIGAILNTARFEVRTKGGVMLSFDGAHNSTVRLGDGSVLLWSVSRTYDSPGNYIEYQYQQNGFGDFALTTIRYSGHVLRDAAGAVVADRPPYAAVDFDFEAVADPSESFIAGRLLRRSYRLRSITTKVAPQPSSGSSASWRVAARYELGYEARATGSRYVLRRLVHRGSDGTTLQPTTFTYSTGTPTWTKAPYQLPLDLQLASIERLRAGFRFAQLTGGVRLPDLLFAAQIEGRTEAFAFRNTGSGWTIAPEMKPPLPFVSDAGADLGAAIVDLNGDGLSDLLHSQRLSGKLSTNAYLATASGWQQTPDFALPVPLSTDGKRTESVVIAAFSNPNRPDVLYAGDGVSEMLINSGSRWLTDPAYRLPVAVGPGARALDLNCDGRLDLLAPANGQWHAFRFDTTGWSRLAAAFEPTIPTSIALEAVALVDLNNDGCRDLIVSSAVTKTRRALLASPGGWLDTPAKAPPFDLTDASGVPLGALVVDVDADGSSDIVAHRLNAQGQVSRFAYAQTSTGWRDLGPAFNLPVIADHRPAADSMLPLVGDIDGDGYDDLAIPTGLRNQFGRVFTGSPNGYVDRPAYVPPTAFARRDQQDRGVRFVDLNSDGLPDVLYRRDVIRDGKLSSVAGAYLNTGAGWRQSVGLTPPFPLAADWVTGSPAVFADVDGDSYIDFLYSYRRSDGTSTQRYFRNEPVEDGTRRWVEQAGSALIPPSTHPFAVEKEGDQGVRVVDVNGDGRADLLFGHLTAKTEETPQPVETCPASGGPCTPNRALFLGDAFINSGAQWLSTPAFRPPVPFIARPTVPGDATLDLQVSLLDIDGDALPDLVARFRHPHDSSRVVNEAWLNNGDGWRTSSITVPVALDTAFRDPRASVQWADINADGLSDLVFSRRERTTNSSSTWLSTGQGFSLSPTWQLPLSALGDRTGDQGYRLLDVNGDGFLDILYARAGDDGSVDRGAYVNDGTRFISLDSSLLAQLPAVTDAAGRDLGVRFVDVDGNGLPDVVRAYSGEGSTVVEQEALLNSSRRSELLTEIEPGYGVKTSISYQTLIELGSNSAQAAGSLPWNRVYEAPSAPTMYPIIAPTPAAYVVRHTASEGAGSRSNQHYRYGAFRMHVLSTRSLGYGWRESYHAESGLLARVEFVQTPEEAGRPRREAACWIERSRIPTGSPELSNLCPSGSIVNDWMHRLSETVNVWSTTSAPPQPASAQRVRHTLLTGTSTATWEIDGQLVARDTTVLTYDSASFFSRHQNVVSTKLVRLDGTEVRTENVYGQDDEQQWYLGRLTRSTVHKLGDIRSGTPTLQKSEIRVTSFEYDALTGLLMTSTTSPGTATAVTTSYARDLHGNVRRVVLSTASVQARIDSMAYDPLGRWITGERNALGHWTTYVRDPLTGSPRSVRDPNGVEVRFGYDGFGRTVADTSPTGVATTVERLPATALSSADLIGIRAAYAERMTIGKLPPITKIFDAHGRLVRTVSEGFTLNDRTSRPIYTDLAYDPLGRVVSSTLPYDRGARPRVQSTSYDVLGRPLSVKRADGNAQRSQYAGLSGGGRAVVSVDALGRRTRIVFNSRGLPTLVEDQRGATVRYEYDAGDRLEVMVSPSGAVTRTTYDANGNRESVSDPDLGLWRYSFDALGQLRRQEDAKGIVTTLEYDMLGRIKRRIISTGESVIWTYDAAANGVGRIDGVKTTQGYSRLFQYDAYGRPAQSSETIDGTALVTGFEYDEYGRVVKTRYPVTDGAPVVATENRYDRKGYLVRVTGQNGQALYWQLQNADALGRTTREQFGNGIETTSAFDSLSGLLSAVLARKPGQAAILDLTLGYDDEGSLRFRRESIRGIQERFSYDQLDRVQSISRVGASPIAIDYDAVGRVASHSTVGAYDYSTGCTADGWKPHYAVQAIRRPGKAEVRYCYDANGNRVSGGGLTFVYNGDNRVREIRRDATHWTTFDYEPSGHRYRQVARDGGTAFKVLYSGSFERISELDPSDTSRVTGTRLRYYLSNEDGEFAFLETRFEPAVAGSGNALSKLTNDVWYLHKDHLGSVVRISSFDGALAARYWYDAWGRQTEKTSILAAGQRLGAFWRRGFTGHEHLREVGLIHMNGRVYDPESGVFISADPTELITGYTQSLGRYAYAFGNPLKFTDPTGYLPGWLKRAGKTIGGAVVGFVVAGPAGAVAGAIAANDGARRWVQQNWREIVVVTVAVAVTVGTGGSGAILAGMAAGAAAGGTRAALYGGDIGDILTGAIKGGIIGGLSGAAFAGVGEAFSATGSLGGPDSFGAVLSHGAVGGGVSELEGGDFWSGFAAAALTKASSSYGPTFTDPGLNVARAAVVGGTVAAVGGGKFANGAIIGAYSFAFNDALHSAAEGSKVVVRSEDRTPACNCTDADEIAEAHWRTIDPPIEPVDAPWEWLIGGVPRAGVSAAGGVARATITGYTKHGINQAISRNGVGVTQRAIIDAVKNPVKTMAQRGGVTRYVGRDADVVLNKAGKVITVIPKNSSAHRIKP